jgi:hypothetical protein
MKLTNELSNEILRAKKNSSVLNISNYPSGIYFYQVITSNKKIYRGKLIKY